MSWTPPVAPRTILALLSVFVFLSSPASGQQKIQRASLHPDADEYAIYNLIGRTQFRWKGVTKIVISDSVGMPGVLTTQMSEGEPEFEAYVRKLLPQVHSDTVAGLAAKGRETYQLEDQFNLSLPCFLVTYKAMNQLFHVPSWEDGWSNFYKKYPGAQGLLFFSPVGFNHRRNQALVYFGDQSGTVGGAGYLVLLAKKGRIWTIAKIDMLWIS